MTRPFYIFGDLVTEDELATPTLVNGNAARWFGLLIMESAEAHGIKIGEARIRVYATDLADIQALDVIAAFRRARREGSGFFPSVAEVRKQLVASPDDLSLIAWTTLERAAEDVGGWESVEFADPALAKALGDVFGSWPEFCQIEIGPELALKRQQFLAAYRDARRTTRPNAPPVKMNGLLAGQGTYTGTPKLIGAPPGGTRLIGEGERNEDRRKD